MMGSGCPRSLFSFPAQACLLHIPPICPLHSQYFTRPPSPLPPLGPSSVQRQPAVHLSDGILERSLRLRPLHFEGGGHQSVVHAEGLRMEVNGCHLLEALETNGTTLLQHAFEDGGDDLRVLAQLQRGDRRNGGIKTIIF